MNPQATTSSSKREKGPTISLSPGPIYDYLLKVGVREHPLLAKLRGITEKHQWAQMATPPDQVAFIQQLLKLINAKRAIEVGVFTGYGSLAIALALPEDGKLVALDINEDYANHGRPIWAEAKVDHKIDLRLAPAVESLDAMLEKGEAGTYDFGFIDADKPNYDHYYERLLKLVRPNGVIAVDNVLWSGKVIDDVAQDDHTVALRALNLKISKDPRVEIVMLGIADGLTLARVLPVPQ